MKLPLVLMSLLGSLALCRADAVRLQVNGPDGKPVAGAKVRVVESRGLWFRRTSLPPLDLSTDANGEVALESKQPLAAKADEYTKDTLSARVLAPGLAVGALQLKAGANTLVLAPSRDGALEGVALGEDQQPLENAHLFLTGVRAPDDKYLSLSDALALEATTDAQGHWTFEALPATGEATIEVRDPRYKRESFHLDLSQKTPPLFLTAGATIKGRLLAPDGKGAAGVKIFGGDFDRQFLTDAGGRFVLSGLGEGDVYLQTLADEQKLPFLVPARQVDGIKAGAVRDIGDWKTEKGVLLKGRLVDSISNKPVEGASASTWADRITVSAQSDKTGAFEMFVPQSASSFSVYAADFASLSRRDIPNPKNGVIDMGILALVKGAQVKGVLVDEAGNPVVATSLFASKNGDRNYARTDSQSGAFSFGVLEAGEYAVKMDGFEVASGATFRVGPKGAPPLRVVVKGKAGQSDPAKRQQIAGRVVDGEGRPIAGAKIAFRLQDKGGTYTSATAFSQSDGTFATSSHLANATLSVTAINRPGFVRGSEKIEAQDGGYRLNLSLQKRGEALRGRVVDAQGQPVAGAYVGLESGDDLPVATGADGTFALPDAPLAGAALLASNGPTLARITPQKAGERVEIALPATPPEDKAALAEQALDGASLDYEWQSDWEVLGQQRIEALLLRRHANKAGNEWWWTRYLQKLAQQEPQVLVRCEAELRALTAPETIPELDRLVMLARATSPDTAEREKARAWLGAQEGEKREFNSATLTRLLAIAQVGAALDKASGKQWLDYAGQIATQLGSASVGENSWEWGTLAARVAPDAPQTLAEDWSSTAQIELLVSAMRAWREDGNLSAAGQGWKTLQTLALDAAKHPDPKIKVEGFVQKPAELLQQAQGEYVRLLARTDAKAALALTDPLRDFEKVQALQDIAGAAVTQKQFDIARQAIGALLEVPIGNPEYAASAAAIAQKFDPKFAADVWARAYSQARPHDPDSGRGYRPSVAAYAGARAHGWPGESRILIEREWAGRLAQSARPTSTDNDFDFNGGAMKELAAAMASLSPRRALEMAEQVPEKDDLRAQTRHDIAVALLTPPSP